MTRFIFVFFCFFTVKQLCSNYRKDASDLVMEWVAFSHSKKNCKLNQENLEIMERTVIHFEIFYVV